jgi:hypothetical protein
MASMPGEHHEAACDPQQDPVRERINVTIIIIIVPVSSGEQRRSDWRSVHKQKARGSGGEAREHLT